MIQFGIFILQLTNIYIIQIIIIEVFIKYYIYLNYIIIYLILVRIYFMIYLNYHKILTIIKITEICVNIMNSL